MIKPRSQPSHFELQAEAQHFGGQFSSHSSDSFKRMNAESMLHATPMESMTIPATKDRGSKVGKPTDPIISTEAPQPAQSGFSLGVNYT